MPLPTLHCKPAKKKRVKQTIMSICVIGAGISGLSTAVCIQQMCSSAKVTIVADKLTPNTTSDIPAGFWRPPMQAAYHPDPRTQLVKTWSDVTFQKIAELWRQNAKNFGVDMVSGYEFDADPIPIDSLYWKDTVYGFRRVPKTEIEQLGYFGFKFQQNGGVILQRRLNTLEEVFNDFDVIVNCSGLGAHSLVKDTDCFPIRGQTMRVEAPFVKMFFTFTSGGLQSHIAPNQDTAFVGGTHQVNDWDTSIRPADRNRFWNDLVKHMPCIKNAKILSETVGLRPGRDKIRLEVEKVSFDGNTIPVVHNYGHGGAGVTMFYGCAKEAAGLAVHELRTNKKRQNE